MIKLLLVENEQALAKEFCEMISRLYNDIKLLEVCETVEQALVAISIHEPNLVFLDVELNNGETSFDILRQLSDINFEIVFVTAHNKYAVQAIKYSALDYLMKPISEEDLSASIQRYHNKKKTEFYPKQLETLFANLNKSLPMNQVALPTVKGLDFISIDSIIYCEGESSQTAVYLEGKNIPLIISKTLKDTEELFSSSDFFRIHKSYLINLKHIKKYLKGKDGQVVLSNQKTLDVSRNYKDAFLQHLKNKP